MGGKNHDSANDAAAATDPGPDEPDPGTWADADRPATATRAARARPASAVGAQPHRPERPGLTLGRHALKGTLETLNVPRGTFRALNVLRGTFRAWATTGTSGTRS